MKLEIYFDEYKRLIYQAETPSLMEALKKGIESVRERGGKLMFAGNGASASIASHLATDFSKQAGVRSMAFNDANLITALSNDCGFENWIAKAIEIYACPDDLVILISSSGRSPNVIAAAKKAKEMGLYVAAFTGFECNNQLGAMADINFWVDSRAYNIIECTHMIWLAAVCDMLIGNSVYSVTG